MHLLAQVTGAANTSMWPFAVLAICLAAIIIMITKLRIHAFVALLFAAFLAGILAEKLPGEYGTTTDPSKERSHWVQAIELATAEFGTTAGKITAVIAFAAIISYCLMESGAADKVVRRFLNLFGEKRAGDAIASSSYILSIPIFFDTFYMLLLPLARALRVRTGKDYILYTMAICCAGIVTHSLLVPHPGPLAMAEILNVNIGLTIIVGFIIGIFPVAASWFVVKWINTRVDIPLRETAGASIAELRKNVERPERELPSLLASLVPVLLPIILISTASTFDAVPSLKNGNRALYDFVQFVGNRNVALIIGAACAVLLLLKRMRLAEVFQRIGPPLETAGMIILITSAGGAFGLMLKNAGVGTAIQAITEGRNINLIFLSWVVAGVIRIAQGSATVAMLTTAAMISPMLSAGALPYHPVYIFCAIGFGAMMLSWMNDSGFWVVGRLSGFTEKETLKTWTVVATVNSFVGLIVTWIASILFPLVAK